MDGKTSVQLVVDGAELSPREVDFDPLFLLACAVRWRTARDLNAGWEIIHAAKSPNPDERNLALDLLESVAGYARPVMASPPSGANRESDGRSRTFWPYHPAESWR